MCLPQILNHTSERVDSLIVSLDCPDRVGFETAGQINNPDYQNCRKLSCHNHFLFVKKTNVFKPETGYFVKTGQNTGNPSKIPRVYDILQIDHTYHNRKVTGKSCRLTKKNCNNFTVCASYLVGFIKANIKVFGDFSFKTFKKRLHIVVIQRRF